MEQTQEADRRQCGGNRNERKDDTLEQWTGTDGGQTVVKKYEMGNVGTGGETNTVRDGQTDGRVEQGRGRTDNREETRNWSNEGLTAGTNPVDGRTVVCRKEGRADGRQSGASAGDGRSSGQTQGNRRTLVCMEEVTDGRAEQRTEMDGRTIM